MKINVKAKVGGTTHRKYGALVEGAEMTIDEEDFGDEIFERVEAGAEGEEAPPEKKKKGGNR